MYCATEVMKPTPTVPRDERYQGPLQLLTSARLHVCTHVRVNSAPVYFLYGDDFAAEEVHVVPWPGMAWHSMAWHGIAWHGMAWHDMTRHDMT